LRIIRSYINLILDRAYYIFYKLFQNDTREASQTEWEFRIRNYNKKTTRSYLYKLKEYFSVGLGY